MPSAEPKGTPVRLASDEMSGISVLGPSRFTLGETLSLTLRELDTAMATFAARQPYLHEAICARTKLGGPDRRRDTTLRHVDESALGSEDQKIITLARAARARVGSAEGAAVRDETGRTYAAAA